MLRKNSGRLLDSCNNCSRSYCWSEDIAPTAVTFWRTAHSKVFYMAWYTSSYVAVSFNGFWLPPSQLQKSIIETTFTHNIPNFQIIVLPKTIRSGWLYSSAQKKKFYKGIPLCWAMVYSRRNVFILEVGSALPCKLAKTIHLAASTHILNNLYIFTRVIYLFESHTIRSANQNASSSSTICTQKKQNHLHFEAKSLIW